MRYHNFTLIKRSLWSRIDLQNPFSIRRDDTLFHRGKVKVDGRSSHLKEVLVLSYLRSKVLSKSPLLVTMLRSDGRLCPTLPKLYLNCIYGLFGVVGIPVCQFYSSNAFSTTTPRKILFYNHYLSTPWRLQILSVLSWSALPGLVLQ